MNVELNNTQKKDIRIFGFVIIIEVVYIGFLLCTPGISFLFFALLFSCFLIYLYPELSLVFALTGNILLYVIFDNLRLHIVAPVIISYLLFASSAIFFHNIRTPNYKFKIANKMLLLVFLLGVLLVIGLSKSKNMEYGKQKVVFYFLINFPLFLIPLLFSKIAKRSHNLLMLAYLAGIVLSLVSFLAPNKYAIVPSRFSPSESVNPIFLARSLGISGLCGIYLFSQTDRRLLRLLIVSGIIVMIPPMIWSGSRGPLLGFFLSGLFYYLLQPSIKGWKKITIFGIGSILGTLIILKFATGIADRLTVQAATEEGSTVFRILSWIQAAKDFAGSPLTGIGTGSFYLETPWIPIVYPHNLILEFACETGIIGLFLIILFLLFTLKLGLANINHFFKQNKQQELQISIGILCIFLYSFWNSMFSGDVFKNEIIWLSSGIISTFFYSVVKLERQVNI